MDTAIPDSLNNEPYYTPGEGSNPTAGASKTQDSPPLLIAKPEDGGNPMIPHA